MDHETAIAAALAAADVIRERYGRPWPGSTRAAATSPPKPISPLSRPSTTVLSAASPDDAITRRGDRQRPARPAPARRWLVDPLLRHAQLRRRDPAGRGERRPPRRRPDHRGRFRRPVHRRDVLATDGTVAGSAARTAPTAALPSPRHPAIVDINLDPPFPVPRSRAVHPPPTGLPGPFPPPGHVHHARPALGGGRPPGRLLSVWGDPSATASTSPPASPSAEAAGCVVTGVDGTPWHRPAPVSWPPPTPRPTPHCSPCVRAA